MNRRISAYLTTQFSHADNIDFNILEKIGRPTIYLMYQFVAQRHHDLNKNQKRLEERLFNIYKNNPADAITIKNLEYKIENAKVSTSNEYEVMESLADVLKSLKDISDDYPVIPNMRNEWYLWKGDDVMLYISKDSEKYYETKDIKRYNWIYGKVHRTGIGFVNVFTNQGLDLPMTSYRGREREILYNSPLLFKRDEFFKLRSMIETNSDPEFLEIFFKNSNAEALNISKADLIERIMSGDVEAPTEEERIEVEHKLLIYADNVLEIDLRKEIKENV